jgi:homoaconitase/3-isopropylmalate dehydratase large subunit
MTICNMSIEAGARAGMVAPDETTYEFLRRMRPRAPTGMPPLPRGTAAHRRAEFDAEVYIDAASLSPFVTWGTNPGQGVPLSATVPDPELMADDDSNGRREGVGVHGPSGRHPDAGHPGRCRVRRLVHQRPYRGPAGGRRCCVAARSPTACGC